MIHLCHRPVSKFREITQNYRRQDQLVHMPNHADEGQKPSFVSIPIIDYSLALSPTTKTLLLEQLKEALVMVGFFYLKNPPIAADVKEAFVEKAIQLCNLPLEKKLEIDMVNSRHFLGYSRLGAEKTAQRMDHRELFHVNCLT